MKASATMTKARVSGGLLLGLLTLVAGVVSCTDLEEAASFTLRYPIAVTQQEQCMARDDSRRIRFRGILDTWMRNRYYLFPMLDNNLMSTEALGPLYAENNVIQIIGAYVNFAYPANLDAATKAMLSEEYYVVAASTIPPEDSGVAQVLIIPPEVGNALAAEPFTGTTGYEIVAKIRMEGQLMDGTIVQSNEYLFPIDICSGCLYQVVTDNCAAYWEAQDMKPPCLIGQDEGVDCRLFALWALGQGIPGN